MIEIRDLVKVYNRETASSVIALNHVSCVFPDYGMIFVLGKSGSGKTTLLNLLGGLDAATDGEIIVGDKKMSEFQKHDYDAYRNSYVGFVFQEYNLLDDFTVEENIALALELQGVQEKTECIKNVLDMVDLAGYEECKMSELSGGQKQRVAIARALAKNPEVIIADEPTGALDSVTGKQIFELLKRLSKDKLIIVVSHDRELAEVYSDQIIELADGKIVSTKVKSLIEETRETDETPQMIRSRLPVKIAMRIGMQAMRRKKIRLAIVVVLSLVSLVLLAFVDMVQSYDKKKVIANSLYDTETSSVAIIKEKYLTYDSSGNWYNDHFYMEQEEIEELAKRTGNLLKGVYIPAFEEMNIEQNYDDTTYRDTQYGLYATNISGFVEVTNKDLESFGYELIAGMLPNGAKDEIAISKYMYESFVLAGYSEYTGPRVDFYDENSEWIEQLTWDEFRMFRREEMNGKHYKPDFEYERSKVSITKPKDIIGKTIFIGRRNYTITGIIDTKFDSSAYEDLKNVDIEVSKEDVSLLMKIREIETERKYGSIALGFVGEGKIEEISSRYASVVTVDGMKLTLENDTICATTDTIARLSDVDADANMIFWDGWDVIYDFENGTSYFDEGNVLTELEENDVIIPTLFFREREVVANDSIFTRDISGIPWEKKCSGLKMSVSYADQRTTYLGTKYQAVAEINGEQTPGIDWGEAYNLGNVFIISDKLFETLSEGREGIYAFCITAIPKSKDKISELIISCDEEISGVRYSIQSAITAEIDTLDGVFIAFARIARYIVILFAMFAMVMFYNFISTSITYKEHDIGIMRALGMRRKDVYIIFMTESLIIMGMTFVLASIVTFIIAQISNFVLQEQFQIVLSVFHFELRQVILLLAFGIFVAVFSTIIPTFRIAVKKPIEAIRR